MTTHSPRSSTAAEHWEPKYPFDLVVTYEDLATRNLAMRLHDQLARQLQDDYDLQCSWWKFSHLAEPGLRDGAADAAVDADMVILSVHAARELPGTARQWIDDWASRREHHKGALVALVSDVEGHQEETKQLLSSLHRVARQAHLDFFPHLNTPGAPPLPLRPTGLAERTHAVTPTLLGILQHRIPVPREGPQP